MEQTNKELTWENENGEGSVRVCRNSIEFIFVDVSGKRRKMEIVNIPLEKKEELIQLLQNGD